MVSATMPPPTEPHIILIGAGVTGLLIAHGLQNEGIKFSIFEAEDPGRFRPKEWTMGMHWGLPAMEQLLSPEMAARIPTDASVDPDVDYHQPPYNGAYIFDGVDGHKLKDLTVSDRIIRVSRRKLRGLFREGIDVNYGHVLAKIEHNYEENTVTAIFVNGARCTGTMMIGCDGLHSKVRKHLFRDDPERGEPHAFEGVDTVSMAVSYANPETARLVRSIHPIWFLALHPDMLLFVSLQDAHVTDKPEEWIFFIFASWREEHHSKADSEELLRRFREHGKRFAEPFRTMLREVPDHTKLSHSDVGYWPAEPWSTEEGSITLAGDAAHPMPPFRGQGCNHAAQDAYNIVDVIKQIRDSGCDHEVQKRLLDEYTAEVAQRGGAESLLSVKNGRMMLSYDDFKESPYMKQGLSRG